jgi:hypothetical protein
MNLHSNYVLINILFLGFCFQGLAQNYHLGFDGVDDYVGITSYVNMSPTDAVTVEAWIKGDSASTILFIYDRIETNDGYGLIVNPDGTAGFEVNGGGTGLVNSSLTVLDGAWNHVAGTYDKDSGMLYIYVNGVPNGSTAYSSPITYDPEPRNRIGGTGGSGNRHFEGEIDEVRVWNVARTPQQIQDNQCETLDPTNHPSLVAYWRMNEGSGIVVADLTSNGNDGTALNGPIWILDSICPEPDGFSEVMAGSFNIYPNPMSDFAIMDFHGTTTKPDMLRVLNVAGQTMKQIAINHQGQILFEKGQLASGLYLVNVISDNKILYSERLIIE